MALPREHLIDELATAYMQALAAIAGATIAVSRLDYGVDGTLKQIERVSADRYVETGFPVDFQIKGTTTSRVVGDGIVCDLKARNYDLRREAARCDALLPLSCVFWTIRGRLDRRNRGRPEAARDSFLVDRFRAANQESKLATHQHPRKSSSDIDLSSGYDDRVEAEVRSMIDAGPSLEAAGKISGRSMADYLLARGWTAGLSKLDKFTILTWQEKGSSPPVQLVLPVWPGVKEERQRVADALRAVAAVERRDVFSVARDVEGLNELDRPIAVMGGFADGD